MKAIITVVGPDRVGIIAEVCTLLAELHISVVEISQTIMEGTFTMIPSGPRAHRNLTSCRAASPPRATRWACPSACSGRISSRPCTPSDREESHAEPL